MPRKPAPTPLSVTLIAESQSTIDVLHAYLEGAGVSSRTTRELADGVTAATTAAVLFPDEFEAERVVERVRALRSSRPTLFLVVVTNAPQRLRPALDPDGKSLLPLVMSKPAFSWAILDAIRAHAAGGGD